MAADNMGAVGMGTDLRDKDRVLADGCGRTARAATEGVEWLVRHRDPSPRIETLQKQLRRQAVEARRLATAAARPMSVGVFGASQMGKSFLIGKLITPSDRPIDVVFGKGADAVRQDFLQKVNPEGGNETTGLVTRFSLRSFDTPPGNPVVLRLLREVDIVKIIANTFLFDCKGQYRIQIRPGHGDQDPEIDNRTPNAQSLAALSGGMVAGKAPLPGMSIEDVYELREYFENALPDHLLAKEEYESYWLMLETHLPGQDTEGRARLLEPLWARLEEFTALYVQLKRALDTLRHPYHMYTSLAALADRRHGVLHVDTLRALDDDETGQSLTVIADNGAMATLPMPVVTALTAELCVTLANAPWPFFTHTDLLDFPGARSRENKAVHDFLRSPDELRARSYCFLRGKVAVLFDNYAADLDLNVMLLCASNENHNVTSLPGLMRDWINRTHGDDPAKRQGRMTGLFYCLTKGDTMFEQKVGAEAPVQSRMENNLGPYPGWINEWHPGQPFDNIFLVRNPGYLDRGLFIYDKEPEGAPKGFIPDELGLTADFASYLEGDFRRMYLSEPLVNRHIAEPELRLDEMLRLNDGGTSYLAGKLGPVCNPDLKFDQIAPRAERANESVFNALFGFYETGDMEKRLTDRLERIRKLIKGLRSVVGRYDSGLIGPFIADFQIDESLMEAAYRHYRRNRNETRPARDAFDDIFGDDDGEVAEEGFGSVMVEWWARHLSARVANSPWCARLGIDEEVLAGFVEEMVTGAERRGLARQLESRIDAYTLNAMPLDAAARRVAIFTTLALNDEMNHPGGRDAAENRDRFAPPPRRDDPAAELPEDPKVMNRIRVAYFKDWMDALEDLTRLNASWGAGGNVDLVANAKLGEILSLLGRTV